MKRRIALLLVLMPVDGLFPDTATGKEFARMTTIALSSPAFHGGEAN